MSDEDVWDTSQTAVSEETHGQLIVEISSLNEDYCDFEIDCSEPPSMAALKEKQKIDYINCSNGSFEYFFLFKKGVFVNFFNRAGDKVDSELSVYDTDNLVSLVLP